MGIVERSNEYAATLERAYLEGRYLPETFGEFSSWLTQHGSFMHD